ncbi:hybrid sensor histidine kinase/response regulator [Aquimarina algiphila]|uniref:hybrid sensor histidine kinase/response regulator n=1 Tax=Aquimarina algiphila TaxID=2047982 RepID=UPI00249061B7|nr:hybrid sensor histidine kinase/response regulator transcription factor [Aquimarina algiphila]
MNIDLRMFNKTCSFLFFFYLITLSLFSQEIKSDFDFVSIKEGISKVGIYSIAQDDYGFIWISTNGSGLYKFDGVDYNSYKYVYGDSTSLGSNLVFTSYLGKNNKLWVGTEDGLNLYNRNLDHFIKIRIQVAEIDQTNISVLSINEDNKGNLLIGTRLYGLLKMNLETKKVERIRSTEINIPAINSINISNKGSVYLGTSLGLREYDAFSNQVIIPKVSGYISSSDFNEPIQYILVDNKDNIWAGTYSQGLYKYQLNNTGISGLAKFPISKKRLLSLIQLPDHTFLVGSENDGLFHLNSDGKIIKNYTYNNADENSISSNSIWSLFVDKDARVWMGYYNSGVVVSDKLYDKFNDIESSTSNKNSLQTGSVTGIINDENNRLWVSMDGGGIDVFDSQLLKVEHINSTNNSLYSGLTSDYIQTIFIDSKKNVLAGSWDNGLYILKNGDRKFSNINIQNSNGKLLSNAILSIAEDKDGLIWIGTFYNGIYTFNIEENELINLNTGSFEEFNIFNSDVRKVLVDSDNNIWLGTTSGLFKITKEKGNELAVTSFVKPMGETYDNKKSTSHILSIYESKKGDIWIGTRGAGICKYDKKKKIFKWYNKALGLTEENIAGIIEDDEGNIWVSGNSGISKINDLTKTITYYTTSDGLLSDDFNFNAVFKDNNGMLYFGNYKGVDYFQPKDLSVNKTTPLLYLTGFKIFNKEVVPNGKNSPLVNVIAETNNLELNHKQSVFTIDYTAINYTRPDKNLYAYYLEGLEESWNFVGNQRTATYTNLDYGDYTFKLKAANNDGIWNEEPLELKITILPPWWKTNWAIFGYLMLFSLGVYLLNRITQNRIREKELIKNERIKRVQEEELHEKKMQFFTNISHEFRTPLTLMISPLKDIINDETLNLPENTKEKHKIIYKNTNRLYRLINELMDIRKLELNKFRISVCKINLFDFTEDIVSYFKEEAYSRNIQLDFDSDISEIFVWADQKMLEKIIFNILSNAIKVTPDDGAINVSLTSSNKYVLPLLDKKDTTKTVEIIISDTGPGLKKKQVSKIFERFYQVENLNKSYYGGTGIGLEVVQSFVGLHKGKVEVESKFGKGTTFKIIFPRGKKHFSKKQIVSDENEVYVQKEIFMENIVLSQNNDIQIIGDQKKVKNKKLNRLLLVEDNIELRNYLKNELKQDYKITTANNGSEGIELAKSILPDIIITDVIMPEMDGFEFCKLIKSDIQTSHIPLLMLTAKTRVDDRIEGIGLGADAYMIKPFDMRLLKLRLSQLINSRRLIFDKYFSKISGAEENANTVPIDKEFIQKVLTFINENISDPDLNVEALASQLNLSRSQLYRKIKALTGQTVNQFLRNVRLERAKEILETGSAKVSEVCYKVGFSSPSYFTKCFKAHFNILPTEIDIVK